MANINYLGKIKGTKILKQRNQERLLKAPIIPASECAIRKREEAEKASAFTRAASDQEFVNRTEKSISPKCPTQIGGRIRVITREYFEDLQ